MNLDEWIDSPSAETVYGFDNQLIASRGILASCDVAKILKEIIPGCHTVEQTDSATDRTGVDYLAHLDCGRKSGVDLKSRKKDFLAHGRDDLALETWSVVDRRVGWTRDSSKACEWILWVWEDTGRFCLVPFPALCGVFSSRWEKWRDQFGASRQRTTRNGDSWISECVFVPRDVVWTSIVKWCNGNA